MCVLWVSGFLFIFRFRWLFDLYIYKCKIYSQMRHKEGQMKSSVRERKAKAKNERFVE